MKTNQWLLMSLAAIGLTGLSGCKNAIIGDWRAVTDEGCGRSKFTMDDSEKGSGTMYALDTTGNCTSCSFEIRSTDDKGSGRYVGELSFDTCACGTSSNFSFECFMNDDEDRMDCTLNSTCTSGSTEYEKLD
jgi:hypothetical protein